MLLNRNNFVLEAIPVLNPASQAYKKFWKEEKRKCIEGFWSMGTWCPPQLYFYLNFWTIKLSEEVTSKSKTYGKPFFREIEWEKVYVYTEAIGFSGFAEDEEFTCHRRVRDYDPEDPQYLPASCYKKDGSIKQYQPAREYLRKFFPHPLGKPLYENEALNVVDLEGRESGKSYLTSGYIAHNFLFDGYTDYDKYLEHLKADRVQMSETLVGAIDTKYSTDLLNKVEDGLKFLPGESVDAYGRKVPSPFSKQWTGSFKPGKTVKNEYELRIQGGWKKGGSGALLHHRSFNDNPLAGNGTRPGRIFLEEVGFFGNLVETLGNLRDCTTVSGVKFGTIYMLGTGGDMVGGATLAVQEVFYNPENYDCVPFPDLWENSPKSIGLFVPPYKADNEFLDKQTGKIDEAKGLAKLEKRREKLKKNSNPSAYNKELENKPLKPSEIFLVTSSNPFPVAELKQQLQMVESTTDAAILGTLGKMVWMGNGKAEFVPDTDHELRMPDWPIRRGDNDKQKGRDVETKGAVCIWHHPNPAAGYGWYSAGYDPTRFTAEEAPTSVSLDSFWIIERAGLGNGLSHDRIVCEYTGRPDGEEFKETIQKLLYYYDANQRLSISCLYENNIRDFKAHLEKHNDLRYLAFSPNIIQTRKNATENEYGLNSANDKVKSEILGFLKRWLSKVVVQSNEQGEKKLQLHYIYSKGLLKELISYNEEGNFDRVIALALAVINAEQLFKIEVTTQQEDEVDELTEWFSRKHFSHRR